MYAVKKEGAFAGYADSIVLIRLHSNGCYVPCKESEAEGFCAKMAIAMTDEGKYRQDMLDKLYKWYTKHGCGEDFVDELWPGQENGYWKNRLRTASTERLEKIYQEKFGGTPCMQ